MKKVVFISGISRGIGKEIALNLANKKEYIVYGCARSKVELNNINFLQVDVANEEEIKKAIDLIVQKEGRLDVVINNAGYGIADAIENTNLIDAEKLFEVNFFGSFLMCKYSLKYLRETKGQIINISSLASIIPIPYQSFYGASKACLNYLGECLNLEVSPFKVQVKNILLGDTKSEFGKSRIKTFKEDDLYYKRMVRSIHKMELDEINGMDTTKVALKIIKSLNHHKRTVVIGFKNKLIYGLFKILPKKISLKIIALLYN